jgi:hypothetical protein
LREALDASTSLRRKLLRYSHTVAIQAAEAAHALDKYPAQRLARWILLAQDRADSEHIYLTHEFLALMLGVRRSGVTDAMAALEGHDQGRSRPYYRARPRQAHRKGWRMLWTQRSRMCARGRCVTYSRQAIALNATTASTSPASSQSSIDWLAMSCPSSIALLINNRASRIASALGIFE